MSQQEMKPTEIARMVQDGLASQLSEFTQRKDLAIGPAAYSESFFQPWVALILVTGPEIKITFKLFFKVKAAQALLSPLLGAVPENVPEADAIDFVRECCNLVAGKLKTSLSEVGLKAGISLPVISRAFDELFFNTSQAIESAPYWKIDFGGKETLLASSYIELSQAASGKAV